MVPVSVPAASNVKVSMPAPPRREAKLWKVREPIVPASVALMTPRRVGVGADERIDAAASDEVLEARDSARACRAAEPEVDRDGGRERGVIERGRSPPRRRWRPVSSPRAAEDERVVSGARGDGVMLLKPPGKNVASPALSALIEYVVAASGPKSVLVPPPPSSSPARDPPALNVKTSLPGPAAMEEKPAKSTPPALPPPGASTSQFAPATGPVMAPPALPAMKDSMSAYGEDPTVDASRSSVTEVVQAEKSAVSEPPAPSNNPAGATPSANANVSAIAPPTKSSSPEKLTALRLPASAAVKLHALIEFDATSVSAALPPMSVSMETWSSMVMLSGEVQAA